MLKSFPTVMIPAHRAFAFIAILATVALLTGCATTRSPRIQAALDAAGGNRSELVKVLRHYRHADDPLKHEAAEFLIANMPAHGFIPYGVFDEKDNEIDFEALDYDSLGEAQQALDALRKEHGDIDMKQKPIVPDVDVITADFLIESIDLAFLAWREKPWAREITWDTFREYILPYRNDNEPIDASRPVCLKRYASLYARMDNPTDLQEAGRVVQADVHRWVRFNDLFYMHPTDQSFTEMTERGQGRCGDISTMMMYALRAVAVPGAADFTPWWAKRDNNHAWEVVLDENGRGTAPLINAAAKVYRKRYSEDPESLNYLARLYETDDIEVPYIGQKQGIVDVTDQYMDTTDVTVPLAVRPPDGDRFAYVCVFNWGEWRAIHFGEIVEGERVTFTKMGRDIAYLPAYWEGGEYQPAGPPFIVTKDGEVRTLVPSATETISLETTTTKPDYHDPDTLSTKPQVLVAPGKEYDLFVWNPEEGDWKKIASEKATDKPLALGEVPANGLYWLVEVKEIPRHLERIFTIEDGRQVWW